MTAQDRLRAATPEVRNMVLTMLDELSSPMPPRELDRAFQDEGFTRAQARKMTLALKHFYVVALVRK
jgi:hypothetical protein